MVRVMDGKHVQDYLECGTNTSAGHTGGDGGAGRSRGQSSRSCSQRPITVGMEL